MAIGSSPTSRYKPTSAAERRAGERHSPRSSAAVAVKDFAAPVSAHPAPLRTQAQAPRRLDRGGRARWKAASAARLRGQEKKGDDSSDSARPAPLIAQLPEC